MTAVSTGIIEVQKRFLPVTSPIVGNALVFLLLAPIFFDIGGGGTNIQALLGIGDYNPTRSVHVSVLLIPLLFGLNVFVGARIPRRYGLLAVIYGGWLAFAAFVGFATDERQVLPLFVIQTLLPIGAFLLGSMISIDLERLPRLLVEVASVATLLAAFPFVRDDVTLFLSDDVDRLIPQFKIYFPVVAVVGNAAALIVYRDHKWTVAAYALAQFALLQFTWSRTGLIIGIVAPLVTYVVGVRSSAFKMPTPRTFAFLACLPLAGLLLLNASSGSTISSRLGTELTSGRTKYWSGALEVVANQPLLGDMFRETDPANVANASSKLYPSHNQFLEFALRGGLPALAMMAVFYWWIIRDMGRALKLAGAARDTATIAIGVCAALLVGSFANLYLTQPYGSSLPLLLFGIVSTRARTEGNATAALLDGEPPPGPTPTL